MGSVHISMARQCTRCSYDANKALTFIASRHIGIDHDQISEGVLIKPLGELEARWILASFDDPSRRTLSLSEQIANKLAVAIVRGEYRPGQRLKESALAETFAVSRGPIREALRLLEAEGLVDIQPRRGTSVQRLSKRDVHEVFEVRSVLLGLTAADVADNASDAAMAFFDAVTEALEKASQEGNIDAFVALIYRGSMYIADTARNKLARDILFSLGRRTLSLTRSALADPKTRRVWLDNWVAFVDGARRRDPAGAAQAMQNLVNATGVATIAVMEHQEASGTRQKAYG